MTNYTESWIPGWHWEDLCGPDGFQIWSPKTNDLGICFQQLCLQIPALSILATTSAYYFGNQLNHVTRSTNHLRAINLRCAVVLLFAILPILQIYSALENNEDVYAIYYLLSAVECLAWLSHLGYNMVLRTKLTLSSRGPVFMRVLWYLLFGICIISFRSYLILYKRTIVSDYLVYVNYGFGLTYVILHGLYGLSFVPDEGGNSFRYREISEIQDERQGLLSSGNEFSRFSEEQDPNYLGVALEDISWLSKLLFYWVNPLMDKGAEGKLHHPDDLYDLPDSLSAGTLSRKLDRVLYSRDSERSDLVYDQRSHSSEFTASSSVPDVSFMRTQESAATLFRALHKCFWLQFYSIGLLKLAGDCAGFAGPMILNRLVGFIEDKSEETRLGYAYAAGLFATTLIAAFCNAHFNFLMSIVGLKMRAALVTTIYKKTLSVSGTVLNSAFSTGEIVNFMSTDTDRVVNSCPSFHALWSIPFQLGVTLFLLYQQVGLAFLAGTAFSVVLIPVNKVIANKIGELSGKMMERKDVRVKMMTEVLRGIKTIKLHVWEGHFIKVITKIREAELKYLKGRKYLDALCVYFWATTPVLIAILTFTTYVLMGNKLTAATVFTTIALLNMLIGPLNAFPWVLNGLTEAWVSLKRIQALLDLPDLDMNSFYTQEMISPDSKLELVIRDGTFKWDKELNREERQGLHASRRRNVKGKGKGKRSRFAESSGGSDAVVGTATDPYEFQVKDLNLSIKTGEFVGIMGTVGAGKSSILNAIMAELTKQGGQIAVADLERGFGYVSQQPWLQRGTIRDNILFGKNYDETRYISVVQACALMEDLAELEEGDLTSVGEAGMTLSGGQKARISLARAVYQDKSVYLLDDIISAVDTRVAKHIFHQCVHTLLKKKTVILCSHNVQFLSRADRIILMEDGVIVKDGPPAEVLANIDDLLPIDLELGESVQSSVSAMDSIRTEPKQDNDSILNEETHETGTIRASVYGSYWKAVGHLLSFTILLSMILMQTSRNLSDWWLSYWVTNAEVNGTNTTDRVVDGGVFVVYSSNLPTFSVNEYLYIYCILGFLNSMFTLSRAFLFAYGGVSAAAKLHKALLRNIVKSQSTFFDISPLGRILNRFSSDTYTVDDSLPFIMNILLAQFFGLLGAVIITLYGLPWLGLVLVPLIPVYSWLQNHYRLTSRELKRLSSVTLSPVYNHFTESLQGLSTIRAFRTLKRFKRDNEENVEVNQKAQFASQAASQWLGLRLQFIGVAMVTGVGMLAAIQHQFDVADPGLVGLAISYALSVTGLLSGVVNAFTETEREMIAVERVDQYIKEVPSERANFIMDPPYAWPSQGVVSFSDVFLRYREHLFPALKGISFETRPAEKIGVVGRTGAGKSSLLVALFRLVEAYQGAITIDTVNISHISLAALRSRLSCIPQEPFLFSGTVRENLDPLDEFRDSEIWSVLSRVDLTPTIKRLGGLSYTISGGGKNLSAGQRQLFCLARALLHNAKILCIDEATANINETTDRQIQQTLRSAFRKSTVITIAHRVQTVLDCDRVLVMSDGEIVEFDSPDQLLQDQNSHFYRLVNNE